MGMKKSEIRKLIYQTLSPAFVAGGFRLKTSAEGFVRKIAGGTQSLTIPLWDYMPRYDFSMVMTIRLDAVEDITNRFNAAQPKYHPQTQTILTQLEHLGARRRWQVVTESELSEALAEAETIVREKIIPFFDRYQDLSSIAVAANLAVAPAAVDPAQSGGSLADRALFSSAMHPARAMSAMTLAYLARLENFDELARRYRRELHPLQPQQTEIFDRLLQFLKEKKDPA
jgi:hypothetical protein